MPHYLPITPRGPGPFVSPTCLVTGADNNSSRTADRPTQRQPYPIEDEQKDDRRKTETRDSLLRKRPRPPTPLRKFRAIPALHSCRQKDNHQPNHPLTHHHPYLSYHPRRRADAMRHACVHPAPSLFRSGCEHPPPSPLVDTWMPNCPRHPSMPSICTCTRADHRSQPFHFVHSVRFAGRTISAPPPSTPRPPNQPPARHALGA